jgi:CheY-like chemotaxis protein
VVGGYPRASLRSRNFSAVSIAYRISHQFNRLSFSLIVAKVASPPVSYSFSLARIWRATSIVRVSILGLNLRGNTRNAVLSALCGLHKLPCEGGQTPYAGQSLRGRMNKRILVADDHGSTRRSLRTLIAQRHDWQVCAEAADGYDAVRQAKLTSPDVAVLDLAMGGLNGVDAAAAIRTSCPATIVLAISMYDAEPLLSRLQSVGVRGFVPKNHLATELSPAIDAVLMGRSWFPSHD